MKWLLKISYSWGDEEPYQEFNSFEEAWDTAKKYACNEAEIASIEANDDVLPQEVTDTDCIRQSEKADAIKISMEGSSLAMANPS